jgi:hypothetical protein
MSPLGLASAGMATALNAGSPCGRSPSVIVNSFEKRQKHNILWGEPLSNTLFSQVSRHHLASHLD